MNRWAITVMCLAATAALVACAFAVVRVGNAAESAIAEARETMHQARLALGSLRGLTFDLRKNWTANTELQSRATKQAAEGVLCEMRDAAAGVRPVLDETRTSIAEIRPVLDSTRQAVDGIGAETQATIAEVRPVLQSTDAVVQSVGGIAASGQAVAEHYQRLITKPTKWQRFRGWLSLFFSGLTAWGNAKLLF